MLIHLGRPEGELTVINSNFLVVAVKFPSFVSYKPQKHWFRESASITPKQTLALNINLGEYNT